MKIRGFRMLFATAVLLGSIAIGTAGSRGQGGTAQTVEKSAEQPYLVEWVYKVKWGHSDEFLGLLKKYQLPILDREKQLGYVTQYTVYSPGLHTSEDQRWDYRVFITYKNQASASHSKEITRQLFPDQATFKREENYRWEITEAHWDLPIRVVDPNAAE